jgi:hypothetical protein
MWNGIHINLLFWQGILALAVTFTSRTADQNVLTAIQIY